MPGNDYRLLRKQSGLTLIELTVGSMLSMLVLAFLLQVFLMLHEQLKAQSSIMTIEKTAIIALNQLSRDIGQAGNIGCPHLTDRIVSPYHDVALQTDNQLIMDSHTIMLRHAAIPPATLLASIDKGIRLTVDTVRDFSSNDLVIISDCKRAEIAKIRAVKRMVDEQYLWLDEKLKNNFDSFAEVSQLEVNQYFVESTGRYDEYRQPINALMLKKLGSPKIALVDGVDAIIFRNLVDNHGHLELRESNKFINRANLRGVEIRLAIRNAERTQHWVRYVVYG